MADQNAIIPVSPAIQNPPANQIGATSNPQTTPKPTLSQAQASGQYKAGKNAPVNGSTPITAEGGYYQSRATDLGLMQQSPKESKLPEVGASLGTNSSPSYGASGILKTPTIAGYQAPNASSYQSGTSLTNSIPNIMADNDVQSAIGNITQPVSTGLMRGVPKISTGIQQPIQKANLWDGSSVLDTI